MDAGYRTRYAVSMARNDGLTEEEGVVADALFQAVQAFLELPEQHPFEQEEFLYGVHGLQGLLATRIVRRSHPEGWPTYDVSAGT